MPPADARRVLVPCLLLATLLCSTVALPTAMAEVRQHPPGVAVAGGRGDWAEALLIFSTSEGGLMVELYYSTLTAPEEESTMTGTTVKTCTWTVRPVPDTCWSHTLILL